MADPGCPGAALGASPDTEAVAAYCLAKQGCYADYPFGPQCLCIKVCGHIVAQLFVLRGQPSVTLKCAQEDGVFWRLRYPAVVRRGHHCPPVQQPYWNTLPLNGEVEAADLRAMLDQAYQAVLDKLPSAQRRALLERATSSTLRE